MELIGLRVVLTLICLALFVSNINSEPTFSGAQLTVGGIMGLCTAGIWLWF